MPSLSCTTLGDSLSLATDPEDDDLSSLDDFDGRTPTPGPHPPDDPAPSRSDLTLDLSADTNTNGSNGWSEAGVDFLRNDDVTPTAAAAATADQSEASSSATMSLVTSLPLDSDQSELDFHPSHFRLKSDEEVASTTSQLVTETVAGAFNLVSVGREQVGSMLAGALAGVQQRFQSPTLFSDPSPDKSAAVLEESVREPTRKSSLELEEEYEFI